MVVVLVEAAVEAEPAVQHERADKRAGAVSGTLEKAAEGWHPLVEPSGRVVVNAVVPRQQTGQDGRVCRQRERRRRERMRVADAASSETIEVWRQPAAIAVRAHPVLAQGVNRDDEDVRA